MKNHLELNCYLTYAGSREYTTKKGETKTLYKFTDAKGNYSEGILSTPLKADAGTVCACVVECGQRWLDSEKRYNTYFRIIAAAPAKKQ